MFISISVARAETMVLCMINYVRRANFTCPPSLVCKKNSSHLLSLFVGILFNSAAMEFIYAKLRNFMISIRSLVAKFARRSDVGIRGYSFQFCCHGIHLCKTSQLYDFNSKPGGKICSSI